MRPVDKKAALGLGHGPGEKPYSDGEVTPLNKEALKSPKPIEDRFRDAQAKAEANSSAGQRLLTVYGLPPEPTERAEFQNWSDLVRAKIADIQKTNDRDAMGLLSVVMTTKRRLRIRAGEPTD